MVAENKYSGWWFHEGTRLWMGAESNSFEIPQGGLQALLCEYYGRAEWDIFHFPYKIYGELISL